MTAPSAPHTRAEQFQFLRDAADGPLVWLALCQSLVRQAAGLPAVYPSAIAAQNATPQAFRVHDVADLARGMVAFYDDPQDTNPYGHVVTVAGWHGCEGCPRNAPDPADHKHTGLLSDVLVWSNDAARKGGVDLVRANFFPDRWGDRFQFGATWLNGYMLPGYPVEEPPEPTPAPEPTVGGRLDRAIETLKAARRYHREQGNDRIVRALSRDLKELRETRQKFGGPKE
ncbi:cell wall-associated hydrolase [Pseudanabaena phage Pam4]|nr:cell wall-associated hydrolase [Pseudanabaena phage Pam4]